MVVSPAPVRVHSQRPLAPNVASVTSVANDRGDNEMILGAVHRSLGIYHLMKGLCNQSSPQMGSLPNEVGRIAQHIRKGEGRKEGKDGIAAV